LIELPFLGGVGIGPLAQFTRQLATMITSGLPLSDALVVLQKQTQELGANLKGFLIPERASGTNP